ncbi:hypothetical protein KQI74_23410 [Paenibacillus barcinonensis]|uniref:hypothetical protein n=1 Tax=Paenibacillus barcinonensis TaxID=198119 RepID=UPI001C0FCE98|nr:hypothetical protein [Paenibacillus barcinonensis]MBU5355208.1 hypothetical protein [Paenibacillus barcinonensis]
MKRKVLGTILLIISLIIVFSIYWKYSTSLKLVEQNEIIETSPNTSKEMHLTWDLVGDQVDPVKGYFVEIGYPNIKLNVKSTGAQSFRIEVKHNSKGTVIFDENIAAGATVEFIDNNLMPLVPSGAYTVTIYGGSGFPKGQVLLKQSKFPY